MISLTMTETNNMPRLLELLTDCPRINKAHKLRYLFYTKESFENILDQANFNSRVFLNDTQEVVVMGRASEIGLELSLAGFNDGKALARTTAQIVRCFNHFFSDQSTLVYICDNPDKFSAQCLEGFKIAWNLKNQVIFLKYNCINRVKRLGFIFD